MHYAAAGSGPVLLFLHGFPEYWGVWKNHLEEFQKDFRCIAPDMRGYNLTEKPTEQKRYHIRYLVEDIRQLIKHLRAENIFLVAQDWGAQVAWSFVLRYPEYVKKFITINATHPALFDKVLQTDPEQQAASQYMLQLRSPDAERLLTVNDFEWLRTEILDPLDAKGALSKTAAEDWMAAWRQPGALTGGLNYYRASQEGPPDDKGHSGGSNLIEDLDPQQLHVDVPTLLIYCEKEKYRMPNSLIGIEKYVSNIRIVHVPDASHWFTIEKPGLLTKHIREFMQK
ncbi:MAG: alpha/beta hydrolase [Legionella sp.]|nr:alpha/beta hydrolase [Legionella sp.]